MSGESLMKLPVFRTVKEAYGFIWYHLREFWLLAIPAIVVVSIAGAVFSWGLWTLSGRPGSFGDYLDSVGNPAGFDFQSFFWLWLIAAVVFAAVFCMYSVAWHRLYLVPSEAASARSAYRWEGRQTRFLFNYIKVFLLAIPVFVLVAIIVGGLGAVIGAASSDAGSAPESSTLLLVILLVQMFVWLSLGLFYARFSMLFPATAADAHMGIREGWRFTKGNGWRLLWIIVLVAVPIIAVTWPINLVISVVAYETGAIGSLTANLIIALIGQFFGFLTIAVGVSALSISYKRISDAQAPQPLGAAGDSV